ncbi:hypothetical protein N7472_010916 [Penicillium cf. griseofulvum]|uniref:Uncharacterized protein n=1 Tax=Penicillium cf. griseofulvum TaxID=2972120 RepID=A0A9W9J1Z7_9EURO|nr:hypothetical protein N7472_010916 [Penicillium cf. griseofulvum]
MSNMSNMLGFSRAVITVLVVLCCSNAFAANCSSTWITSVADADMLRQNCRVVTGHVGIGPFSGDDTVHINLDGIEAIEGTLGEYPYARHNYFTQPSYTLTSSSLKKVDAVEFGEYNTRIVNLTLPSLTSVNDYVLIGRLAYQLAYLDITSLHSARSITLGSPDLKTLHHTNLRNVTSLSIYPMQVDSLDSLSDNELNLDDLYIKGPFPNVNNIPIGFKSVDFIQISDNSSVTLGGSSTKGMTIKRLNLDNVTGFKRSAKLKTLEVGYLKFSDPVYITHLELPFDNLGTLIIQQYDANPLKSITLPPQRRELDRADDQGNPIQTWYWPKNVTLIDISAATVKNTFFDPFVVQQMGLNKDFPPSVLSAFRISPLENSTSFNCTTFRELQGMGRLSDADNFACYDPDLTSGSIRVHVPITLSLVSAVLGISIWML